MRLPGPPDAPERGRLRHLAIDDEGHVLAADEGGDVVLEVATPTGDVVREVGVREFPHDVQEGLGGRLWVAEEFGGSVAVVEGDEVVERWTEPFLQPGGIVVAGDRVGVIDVRRSTVSVLDADAASDDVPAELLAGEGVTHGVADARDRLVVVDTRGDAVLVFETDPRFVLTQRAPLRGTPYGVAYDEARDQVAVTLTGLNEVVVLALDGPQPCVVERYPTVWQPNTVAVDPRDGALYVAGTRDRAVQRVPRPDADAPATCEDA